MSNLIENLKKEQNLSFVESKMLFSDLMEGKYDENEIIEILEKLKPSGLGIKTDPRWEKLKKIKNK